MTEAAQIRDNVKWLRQRIEAAASRSGREASDVTMVVVSKTRSPESVEAALAAGLVDIGENRVQELLAKQAAVAAGARWHLVGHLQRNKVKKVVGVVDLIQSVDTFDLAKEINEQAAKAKVVQEVLIQVNVAAEPSKYGVARLNLEKLVAQTDELRHINTKGLMTMAPLVKKGEDVRTVFAGLKQMFDFLGPSRSWRVLSMGMTNDFEVAVEEGSTMVRIGRAVFEAHARPALAKDNNKSPGNCRRSF